VTEVVNEVEVEGSELYEGFLDDLEKVEQALELDLAKGAGARLNTEGEAAAAAAAAEDKDEDKDEDKQAESKQQTAAAVGAAAAAGISQVATIATTAPSIDANAATTSVENKIDDHDVAILLLEGVVLDVSTEGGKAATTTTSNPNPPVNVGIEVNIAGSDGGGNAAGGG
jgi:hypothetical protein